MANTLQFLAMNIVNQLFDLAEVPVEKRQAINDEADGFVYTMLMRQFEDRCHCGHLNASCDLPEKVRHNDGRDDGPDA